MTLKRIEHPWYDFNKLLSFNGTYNFVPGGRGIGKTFGAKEKAIKRNIRYGEQFIYVRRYKSELVARNTFFEDVKFKFPEWDFRISGNVAQKSPAKNRDDKKREWSVVGYFVALSTAQTTKSIAFPLVTSIIFDEFIIEKGNLRYLPDEVTVFNNFYVTVDRFQDKTRVYFLANAVSINNPYFIEYEIEPDEESEFVIKHDGFIVCHFPDSANFKNSIYQTKFGRFIKESEYSKYAVENEFADNNDSLIQMKDGAARYMFTLETSKGRFGVWHNAMRDTYFIAKKVAKTETVFTTEPDKMSESKILIMKSDKPIQSLRTAYSTGRVMFDAPPTRNSFIPIFQR